MEASVIAGSCWATTMRLGAVAAVFASLMIGAASAQTAPPDKRRAERVAALIEWVKKEGKPSILDTYAAHVLGLGDSALPVRRKAFQDDDSKIMYVVKLLEVNGREVHVLYRMNVPTSSTLWRIDDLGALTVTGLATPTTLSNPHDPYLSRLEETISYLENCREDRPC